MNRFFSKLDLRDIKIDPTGSRFPPDGETVDVDLDVDVTDAGEQEHFDDTVTQAAESAQPGLDAGPVESEAVFDAESASPAATFENGESATTTATAAAPASYANGDAPEPAPAEQSDVLKVSAKSRPSAVAGAIAGVVRELGRAEVQAIGAGATNQAVKAVAIARDYLRESGIEAVCLPSFIDVTIDNEDRTAILLVVEPRVVD
jgi:stage V sporulation protein S